jgi:hypothetical protein
MDNHNSASFRRNTFFISAFVVLINIIRISTILVERYGGGNIPGVAYYDFLLFFGIIGSQFSLVYFTNREKKNPYVILFSLYCLISFAFTAIDTLSIRTAIQDLAFFLALPVMATIRPFSFSMRKVDQALAILIFLNLAFQIRFIRDFYFVLFDRREFLNLIQPWMTLSAGSFYLLLKYAKQPGYFMSTGIIGVLNTAITLGIIGAYRGQLLLGGLAICLYAIATVKTGKQAVWTRLFLATSVTFIAVIILSVFAGRLSEQTEFVIERFEGLTQRYQRTGDLVQIDGRFSEIYYFRSMYPDRKFILGHGIGALWVDRYGMFASSEITTGLGAFGYRTMLHSNLFHIPFKVGLIGFFLMYKLVKFQYKSQKKLQIDITPYHLFLVWYFAFSVYYGSKNFGYSTFLYFLILTQPWIFVHEPKTKKGRAFEV